MVEQLTATWKQIQSFAIIVILVAVIVVLTIFILLQTQTSTTLGQLNQKLHIAPADVLDEVHELRDTIKQEEAWKASVESRLRRLEEKP